MAVIRLRGKINVHFKVSETMDMLNVRKNNYMTIIPSTSSYLGMLRKSKDFLTWGEINQETLEHVIRKRGELEGKIRITDKFVKENTPYPTIKALSKALLNGETAIGEVPKNSISQQSVGFGMIRLSGLNTNYKISDCI